MKLVIVESPTKAKTIGKFLGKEFKVESSYGHIRDLPKSNKNAIDIEAGFVPHYVIPEKKEGAVATLKNLSEKADEVILATDPDREGEAIAWHLAQVLNLGNSKLPQNAVKRIVFHEITKEAIAEAIATPRTIDQNLCRAQEARRVLDRLVGYDLSGLIWKKVRYGLSAGRVQSPALRILVEREREIKQFVPETYWTLTASVTTKKGDVLVLISAEEPRDEARVKEIEKIAKEKQWVVKEVKETAVKRSPNAPFTTSTLQQRASTLLGFSPSRTMRAAQRLYEAGHITYMRTDSTAMSATAQSQMIAYITTAFGERYATPRVHRTKSKLAQEAHEAIRPTKASLTTIKKSGDEKKLYELIWRRAIASQMADAELMRTKITGRPEDERVPEFSAQGSRIRFEGWLKADPLSRGEEVELPAAQEGDPLTMKEFSYEEKETQPLPRYTEAGLVKELEKRGIGRPSTYATIISTLENRGYVTKEGRTLTPTDVGEVVSTFLEKNFTDYISDTFTAEMENELDDIAQGKREYEKTLSEFYAPFHKLVKEKGRTTEKLTTLGKAPDEFKCPKCGSGMVIKLGKSGTFLSCDRFPECTGARTIQGEEIGEPKETGETCPECKEGKLVLRHGKYGSFIGCNRYPKCKYIKQDEAQEAAKKTGVVCPECGKGEIVEKRGRFGLFYACARYPECKFAMKAKPTGKKCALCGSLMMEGTKTIPERCSNKQCPNHNPHKKQG